MSNIDEFRNELNKNLEWQEEIRNFGNNDSVTQFANGKGYEFTGEDLEAYIENNKDAELSDFEMEMVSGGGHDPFHASAS